MATTVVGMGTDDILDSTNQTDSLLCGNGNDIVRLGTASELQQGDRTDGGAGFDQLWFGYAAVSDTLVLNALAIGFESVRLSDSVGNTSGTASLGIDATLVGNGLLILGNNGDNTLYGTSRDDHIVGNGGVDTIVAGAGNDKVIMGIEAGDIDAINAGNPLEGNMLVLTGTVVGIVDLDFSAATDQLVAIGGTAEIVVQTGFSHLDASDLLGAGITALGHATANVLIGSANSDTLAGGAGVDVVVGGAGDDLFLVASAPDFASAEVLAAGLGNDLLRFTSTQSGQILTLNTRVSGLEALEIATAAGDRSGSTTLGINAAAVRSELTIHGNEGANTITGTAKDDVIYGHGGSDSLSGGSGNDSYVVVRAADGTAGDRITDSNGSEDRIFFSSSTDGEVLALGALVSGIEELYLGDIDRSLSGTATTGVNATAVKAGLRVFGNAGANIIMGTQGADDIQGNGGNDSISAQGGADTVLIELDAGSIDQVDAGLANEGNTMRLTGSVAGLVVVDLDVATDDDQLLIVAGASESLVQSDFTHADASEIQGVGVQLYGSGLGNRLIGSVLDDTLRGGGGTDTLSGGLGNDVLLVADAREYVGSEYMNGGEGDDVVRFTSTQARQTLVLNSLTSGIEEAEISDDAGANDGIWALNLDARGLGYGTRLTGNAGANILTGSAYADTLTGGGGTDTLVGGKGDDVFVIDTAADMTAGEKISDQEGRDTLRFSSVTNDESLLLGSTVAGVEVFELSGSATLGFDGRTLGYGATFIGNSAGNLLYGTAKNDEIRGSEGHDTVYGGLGADTVVMAIASDDVDTIYAGSLREGNTLALAGELGVFEYVEIDLSVGADNDQLLSIGGFQDALVQTGFAHVDASALTVQAGAGVWVTGDATANRIVGSSGEDVFVPGLGRDTIEGGLGTDVWIVFSVAEYSGDVYTDMGTDLNDYLYFAGREGETLVLANNTTGIDVVAAGFSRADTTRINLDASRVNGPIGLAGNAGDNVLTGNIHGSSMFDWGGSDRMAGGDGNDDYVIMDGSFWTTGDRIYDSFGYDDLYFCGDSGVLVADRRVSGVERFVVSSAELATGGPYTRDNTITNDAGIDASGQGRSIFLAGSNGDNALTGSAFADEIKGHGGRDVIRGLGGADRISMEVSAASLDAIDAGLLREGNRLILEGNLAGTMMIDLSGPDGSDQITAIGGTGEALVQSGFAHVDGDAVAGDGIEVIGSASANELIGTAQADILQGGAGVDTLLAGSGDDAIVVGLPGEYSAAEVIDGGAGTDVIRFAATQDGLTLTLFPARMEGIEGAAIADFQGDTTGTTALNINAGALRNSMTLTGNDGANVLTGTAFADVLIGNGGSDRLLGGAGDDIYLVEEGADFVAGDSILDSSGFDRLRFVSTIPGDILTLTADVTGLEQIEICDADGDRTSWALSVDASALTRGVGIVGNEGDNRLVGGSGSDRLTGGTAHDTIVGGAGADTVVMDIGINSLDHVDAGMPSESNSLVLQGAAAGIVVLDLTSSVNQLVSINGAGQSYVILGIANVDASEMSIGGVMVTCSGYANVLKGTGLDDVFVIGSSGDFLGDVIAGNGGSDEIRFAGGGAGDTLVLTAASSGLSAVAIATADGDTSGVVSAGISASQYRNGLLLTGNDGANAIVGTSHGDTIVGSGGGDSIIAGAGADRVVVEIDSASLDVIDAGLMAEQNTLVLTGGAAGLTVIDLGMVDQIVSIGGVTETLRQSGFSHLEAGAATTSLAITGTAGANRIAGGTAADTVMAGAGDDVITMDLSGGVTDMLDAGVATEGNTLVLLGVAPGDLALDFGLPDQLVSMAGVADGLLQTGFSHLDARAMTGGAVSFSGTGAANVIIGTAQSDTIRSGLGADRITMDLSDGQFDAIDAGIGCEDDTLILIGDVAGALVVDLSAAPEADQLLSVDGTGESVVQSDFQHVDASGLSGFGGGSHGLSVRGNDAANVLVGTSASDTFIGLAGADICRLGLDDRKVDIVIYESPADGTSAVGATFSFDRIEEFESVRDQLAFGGGFNGGFRSLDDIEADDAFQFAFNTRADFDQLHEALLISAEISKLTKTTALHSGGFAAVVRTINKVGVTSAAGDDGLIVVQTTNAAGIYYYLESDGRPDSVAAGELTLLGIVDEPIGTDDCVFI